MHWSRVEEFTWGYLRPMAVIDVRAGADPDGCLTGWELTDINAGAQGSAFPYRCGNWRVRYQPAASPLAQGPGRGTPGRTGWGCAVGLEKDGRVATCAEISAGPGGEITVTRIVTAYECGAIVNPDTVTSQVEGGTMMALGGALFEQAGLDHGRLASPRLADYRVPRFGDVPESR